jgi:hypothetical protein
MIQKGQLRPNFKQYIEQTRFEREWQKRWTSNADSLIRLNLFSHRAFDDPSVCPIFQWILSNCSTKTLDLKDPENFRDLSKRLEAIGESNLD